MNLKDQYFKVTKIINYNTFQIENKDNIIKKDLTAIQFILVNKFKKINFTPYEEHLS